MGRSPVQGSFALSRVPLPEGASIHPNTASLTYKVPLVQSSVDLKLDLVYQYGITGTFGLPQNWSFDIPYVLDDRSLTINGRTYLIDFYWTDVNGYASGLRYINRSKVSFREISPPKELPSGQVGTYKYQLDQPNGSSVYFDVDGNPLEEQKVDGSCIRYVFSSGENKGPDSGALLEYIEHSSGQRIVFTESDDGIKVTLSTGQITEVTFADDRVFSVERPASSSTRFDHQPFVGNLENLVLSQITHPTGLVSRYEYGASQFIDLDGDTRSLRAG